MNTAKYASLAVCSLLVASHSFAETPDAASTVTTVTTATPATHAGNDVGISSRDGITISGGDVLVTRNGLTEKLTKELELSNGTRVQPDGTLIDHDGGKISLRSSQILTFDGRLLNTGATREAVTTSAATTTTPATTPAAVIDQTSASAPAPAAASSEPPKAALTKEAEDASTAEANRRAKAAEEATKPIQDKQQ